MAIDQPTSTEFDLADIRGALANLRPMNAAAAAAQHGDLRAWLAGWQGRAAPRVERPRIVLFAGIHGNSDAARGRAHVEIGTRMQALTAGTGLVCSIAEQADADVRLYEIATDRERRAPNAAAIARAVVYGMTTVESGLDVLGVATLSPGLQWRDDNDDPFDALILQGGEEIAAAIGAMIAARMAGAPVICDGAGARLAARLLARAQPGAADHIRHARAPAGAVTPAVLDDYATGDTDGADAARAILALRAALAPTGTN